MSGDDLQTNQSNKSKILSRKIRSIRHYKEKKQDELKAKYQKLQHPPRQSKRAQSKEEELKATIEEQNSIIEELYTLLDASNDAS